MELLDRIIKLIKDNDKIVIFRHVQPDGDAYGSSFGLKRIIMNQFPNKKVICLGKKDNELETFFGKMDEIDDDINDYLAIFCDLPDIVRCDSEYALLSKKRIKIDHHLFVETYCDEEWIDNAAGSTCEMIVRLANYAKWNIDSIAATYLYFGLITDTGRMLYCYTPDCFNVGKILTEAGAEVSKIYPFIYEVEQESTRFRGFCQAHFKKTGHCVAYNKLTPEVLKEYGVDVYSGAGMVNALSNMKEIPIWAHFSENTDGTVRGELRSKGLPVNLVANEFGGGGHKQAAGCTLLNWDEVDKCIEKLDLLVFDNLPYSKQLKDGFNIIEKAMEIAVDFYNNSKLDVEMKDDNSPVTLADKTVDKFVREELSKIYPDYGLLSEETSDNLDRINKEFVWILDPIDGTKDFIAHDDEYAINLSLVRNNEPVVGIIAVPSLNKIYYASKDGGAYKKDNGIVERIHTSKRVENLKGIISHFHETEEDRKYFEQYKNLITEVNKVGSAYKFALLAEGIYDINLKLSNGTKEWDIAPGVLLVKEAGGSFTKPNGEEYKFNREDVYNRDGYIVMNKFNKGLLK